MVVARRSRKQLALIIMTLRHLPYYILVFDFMFVCVFITGIVFKCYISHLISIPTLLVFPNLPNYAIHGSFIFCRKFMKSTGKTRKIGRYFQGCWLFFLGKGNRNQRVKKSCTLRYINEKSFSAP